MTAINLLHDPLSPSNSIGDGAHSGRNPRSAVVLRQLASREDTGGNQQDALATFIHIAQRSIFVFCSLQTTLDENLPSRASYHER
jgi:hypothetical protein